MVAKGVDDGCNCKLSCTYRFSLPLVKVRKLEAKSKSDGISRNDRKAFKMTLEYLHFLTGTENGNRKKNGILYVVRMYSIRVYVFR